MSELRQAQSPSPPPAPRCDSYRIWAVMGRVGGNTAATGFLVTTGDPLPRLVAAVDGGTRSSLIAAMLIRDGTFSPEAATDLRGRRIPSWLFGSLLVPAEAGLPAEFRDRPFAAAIFRADGSGEVASFTTLTVTGLQQLRDRIIERRMAGESGAD